MTKPDHLARPIMGTATGLHHDYSRRLLRHELGETPPRQLLAKLHASRHRCAVNLENLFCQVHSNHSILRHGCRPFRSVVLNRSEEHTSELQSLMRISYAVFCLKKNIKHKHRSPHILTTSQYNK